MQGDFDEWYQEVRPPMAAALAAWCGDASLAADSIDEAFVRAVERWDRVRAMPSPAGWVWRTATNVVRRRERRRSLERAVLRRHAASEPTASTGPDGSDVDLRRALALLTERQRTAVVLHHVADLPYAEVAEAMGIAEGTVGATLHQARQALAGHLIDVPLPSDPPSPGCAVADATPTGTAPIDGALP